MKKFLFLFVLCFVLISCQRINLGPKGEGEYVLASAEVPYVDGAVSAMKNEGLIIAEKAAVEKAARVFLSSNSLIEYPEKVKTDILDNYKNFIRRSYVNSSYRKGSKFYVRQKYCRHGFNFTHSAWCEVAYLLCILKMRNLCV